jgi:Rps23 Pro-64 3,4-dihydroxylase Tpa1-like proline 4-hydroxylase
MKKRRKENDNEQLSSSEYHHSTKPIIDINNTIINNHIFQVMEHLKEPLANRQSCIVDNGQLISTIYPVVTINNFLQMESLSKIEAFLHSIPFDLKSTDLYNFRQSMDLSSYLDHSNVIKELRQQMFSPPFLSHLEDLFDLKNGSLEECIGDMSSQSYIKGDYLLCHDDRLDTRQIAYVLYLVNDQYDGDEMGDGGALEFFITDDLNRPRIYEGGPKQLIHPKRNMLVLFKVSMTSFHQVQEVLRNVDRLSISGWYHHKNRDSDNDEKKEDRSSQIFEKEIFQHGDQIKLFNYFPEGGIPLNDESMEKCQGFTFKNDLFDEYFYYQPRI